MLKLLGFVLPLGLDTFAVSTALGLMGLSREQRIRVTLVLPAFEMAMPVVGLLGGGLLGHVLGGAADYIAIGLLVALGAYVLLMEEGGENERLARLVDQRGVALVALGIGISLDELAMGFSIGLLGLSIVLAVILIGAQALVMAQLGLRLGARLGEAVREWAERLAGAALIVLGFILLIEKIV